MNETNNNEALFDELPEKGWKLDVPGYSEEELHHNENDKYLVPIFAKVDGEHLFRGNGVIVGSYLVTAAHVAQTELGDNNYHALWYQYEDKMLKVTDEEITKYINTENTLDKAGGYAIQGKAKSFVEKTEGNIETVIGLDIEKLRKILGKNYK